MPAVPSTLPELDDVAIAPFKQTSLAKKLHALNLDVVKPAPLDPAPHSKVKLDLAVRFTKESLLQKGSTCIVTQCRDNSYNRDVALKKGTYAHLKQIRREYKIHKSLEPHPNVATMHDVVMNRSKRQICLVMELCAGGDLVDILSQADHGLAEDTTFRYAQQIATGLAHIHSQGVAHRDIKSDNICSDETTGVMKIVDFGEASRISDPITGLYKGTPGYMAPEIVERLEKRIEAGTKDYSNIDLLKCDVWAFGITLYTMLTSKFPFTLASQSTTEYASYAKGEVLGKVEDWENIPEYMQTLLLNVLTIDPSSRWSAQQVVSYLEDIENTR
ncbi:CAMK protein kinase [Sphaeroforma arctica JP610]|uniref:CAMK protein kinase n=1 Tax=Sphaeroforma arctica JP610 TaxID=667725 RepID=A0A0L0FSM6_9EUKA|nr:CAMK protein kinase [Sphaeroforma arctica JP610]KNC79807.1 CAMK protein kinase [Sphaeroforma arctica JP610]|eukprot:XP_014153709.1 CAMK protein kinase [Sphaeroforma arctica JP610]